MDDIRLWLEIGTVVVGVVAGWATMRAQLAEARKDAAAAQRSAKDCHQRLETMDRRVTIVERDQAHHGRQLESALARIEGAIVALHARLDRALAQQAAGREE